jgi:hypothetical protein
MCWVCVPAGLITDSAGFRWIPSDTTSPRHRSEDSPGGNLTVVEDDHCHVTTVVERDITRTLGAW